MASVIRTSAPMPTPWQRMFSMRIVNLDYYMSSPIPDMDPCYSQFQGRTVAEVPVIRIYGSTTAGQKTCLHVHKAFPYFYVAYDSDLPQDTNEAVAYVQRLASSIEKAMNMASKVVPKRQHVHTCSLVRAHKFYGYHPDEHLFIKIVLYYPQEVSRISMLLLGGAILNYKFQCYESHIPYLLQVLIDNNLYGMGHVHFSRVKFRNPLPEIRTEMAVVLEQVKEKFWNLPTVKLQNLEPVRNENAGPQFTTCSHEKHAQPHATQPPIAKPIPKVISPVNYEPVSPSVQPDFWLIDTVPAEWVWPDGCPVQHGSVPRQSTCELEADASVEDILNRMDLLFKSFKQTGAEVKMVRSLMPMWEEERLRAGEAGLAGAKVEPCQSAARCLPPPSSHDLQLRNALFELVAEEKQLLKPPSELQLCTSDLDVGSVGCASQNLQQDSEYFQASLNHPASRSELWNLTQAANSQAPGLSQDLSDPLPVKMLVEPEKFHDGENKLECLDNTDHENINEDALRTQFTEIAMTQELDKEVAELLRWMGSSQLDMDVKDGEVEEKDEENISWSQMFNSSEGMEAALVKALVDYEEATKLECQAILDCNREEDQDSVVSLQGQDDDAKRKDLACVDPSGNTQTISLKENRRRKNYFWSIPQMDGSCDERLEGEDDLESSKRLRGMDGEDSFLSSGQQTSRDKKLGISVRDMMRKQRERKPCKLAVSFSELSSTSDSGSFVKPSGLESTDMGRQHSRTVKKSILANNLQGSIKQVVNELPLTTDGGIKQHLHHTTQGRSDQSRYLKFGALPILKTKFDTGSTSFEHQLDESRDDSRKVSPDTLSNQTQALMGDKCESREASMALRSGDDRDCGGGSEKIGARVGQVPRQALALDIKETELEVGNLGPSIFLPHSYQRSSKVIDEDEILKTTQFHEVEMSDESQGSYVSELCSWQKNSRYEECVTEKTERQCSSSLKYSVCMNLDGQSTWPSTVPKMVTTSLSYLMDDPKIKSAVSHQQNLNCQNVRILGIQTDRSEEVKYLQPAVQLHGPDILEKVDGKSEQLQSAPEVALSSWDSLPASMDKYRESGSLFPLVFYRRPPQRNKTLESLVGSTTKDDNVFFGNIKDTSEHPMTLAGVIFDVKSRDVCHLPAFFSNDKKNTEDISKSRQYVEQENWGASYEMESVCGIPTHFENNGTVLYLLTPAKAPPSPVVVAGWLSSMQMDKVDSTSAKTSRGERVLTMDSNTGKLIPLVEIGTNSQDALRKPERFLENYEYGKPSSPKYNESYVLHLTHPPAATSQVSSFTNHCIPSSFAQQPLENPREQFKPTEYKVNKGPEKDSNVKLNKLSSKALSEKTSTKPGQQWQDVSQITGVSPASRLTPLSQAGFRDPASSGCGQQVTVMSIEVHVITRGDLLPDPRYDAISCIAIAIHEDGSKAGDSFSVLVLMQDEKSSKTYRYLDGTLGCEVICLCDEATLFACFSQLVCTCDPDILVGWETQGFSIGLLAERAANLGFGLLKQLSRIKASKSVITPDKQHLEVSGEPIYDEPIIDDEWGRTHGSGLYVTGRSILNLWRIIRGEVKLGIYSLEAVAEAVLRKTVPRVPWKTLTKWFSHGAAEGRFHCIKYFIDRARVNLQIMNQLDLVNRTAELARVFGIDFFSVFSRGSQYRVESMMARLAHTQNFLLLSPSRQQVACQPGMECLPLVMEPESRFYTSPVIVLDFQSLYPSMIIAYNLCFSTCLGKMVSKSPKVLGVSTIALQPGLLSKLKESLTITPNGVMFTPPEVCPGILPRLLQEILSTRIMVKAGMKNLRPDQRVLQRVLNARQFALKLISNVTYGYTAAGFSGRMPCAELADSIVQCGRLTLERAISLVDGHPQWGARVVYGDTDSMFVLVEGRTRDEAFRIGQEIASVVTESNPTPVTLKMEKVYHPCVLLTKKRYVGYSYENCTQTKPTFDAKGIETIRRDSCGAVAKTLEHSLRILFESHDLSQVKQYLQRQWGKILSGRISLQDFVFAKEVRLGTYSKRAAVLPPAAIVASKAMAVDPRSEPRYGERIPYVVIHGEPGARLVDMVVDPLVLIDNMSTLRLHDTYYITKQIIPALQRVFGLVGVDLKMWYNQMPRVYRPPMSKRMAGMGFGTRSRSWELDVSKSKKHGLNRGTIDQYYLSQHCTICGELAVASQVVCKICQENPIMATVVFTGRACQLEREFQHLQALCRHCGGGEPIQGGVACISLDCSVFFERRKVQQEFVTSAIMSSELGYYPPCLTELF